MPREKHYMDLEKEDTTVAQQLSSLLEDYAFYSSGQKEMEESKKAVANSIIEHLQRAGYDGVDYGPQRYQMQTTTTRRIVKEKLLERGVSPSVIEYATEESHSAFFLRGYAKGKKGE